MKTYIGKVYIVGLLFLLLTGIVKAQPTKDKSRTMAKNVFKVNFMSAAAGLVSGFYERKVTHRLSVQIGGNYFPKEKELFATLTKITKGYAVIPEIRIYPLAEQQAPKGVYVGSFLRYRYLEMETEESSAKGYGKMTSYSAGLLVGAHVLALNDLLSLDFFAGPVISKHDFSLTGQLSSRDRFTYYTLFTKVAMRSGITVGIAF